MRQVSGQHLTGSASARTATGAVLNPISVDSSVAITAAQWQFLGGVFGAADPCSATPEHEPNVYVTNVGAHGVAGCEAGGVELLIHAESAAPRRTLAGIRTRDCL